MDLALNPQSSTPNRVTWWEKFAFTVLCTAIRLMVFAFGVEGVYRFSRWFGTMEWLVDYHRRRRFAVVLAQLFPEGLPKSQAHTLCREFFRHARCNKTFYPVLDTLGSEQIASAINFEHREILDDCLKGGQGVYVAMSHHGPYHIGATLMALLGYKMAAVRDRNEGALRRYTSQQFERKYPELQRVKTFYAGAYPRAIYRCLRDGYVLGSAIDVSRVKDPRQKTETVHIFGSQHEFLTGPLRIAIRCRVPVIQAFVLPVGCFRYRVIFQGPLLMPDQMQDEEQAIRQAMAAYIENVERQMRRYPCHLSRI